MDAFAHRISTWLHDALAMVLPVSCVACGQPDRRICAACGSQLQPDVCMLTIPGPSWAPPFPVVSAGVFGGTNGGVVVSAIHALKEDHRTGIARDLAPRLRTAVDRLRESLSRDGVLFVAPPRSRTNFQARGFEPVELLARHARIPLSRELRAVRTRADQSGLSVSERDHNMRGSMVARRPLGGASVVLIDDVMTTGATLREMARAICAAGGHVVGAATVAHTPRRHPQRDGSTFAENA